MAAILPAKTFATTDVGQSDPFVPVGRTPMGKRRNAVLLLVDAVGAGTFVVEYSPDGGTTWYRDVSIGVVTVVVTTKYSILLRVPFNLVKARINLLTHTTTGNIIFTVPDQQ